MIVKIFLIVSCDYLSAKNDDHIHETKNRIFLFGFKNDESILKNSSYISNELKKSKEFSNLRSFVRNNTHKIFNMENIDIDLIISKRVTIRKTTFFIDKHIKLFDEKTGSENRLYELKEIEFVFKVSKDKLIATQNINYESKYMKIDKIKFLLAVLAQHILQMVILYYEKKIKNSINDSTDVYYFFNILEFLQEKTYTDIYYSHLQNFFQKNNLDYNLINIDYFISMNNYNYYLYDSLFLKLVYKIFDLSHYRFMRNLEKIKIRKLLSKPDFFNKCNTPKLYLNYHVIENDLKLIYKKSNVQEFENILTNPEEEIHLNNIASEIYEYMNTHIQNENLILVIDINYYCQFFATLNEYLLNLQFHIKKNLKDSIYRFFSLILAFIFKQADFFKMNILMSDFDKKENNHCSAKSKKMDVLILLDKSVNLYRMYDFFIDDDNIRKSDFFGIEFRDFLVNLNILRHKHVLYTYYQLFTNIGKKYFSLKKIVDHKYIYNQKNYTRTKLSHYEDIKFDDCSYLEIIIQDIDKTLHDFLLAIIKYLISKNTNAFEIRYKIFDNDLFNEYYESLDSRKQIFEILYGQTGLYQSPKIYQDLSFNYNQNDLKHLKNKLDFLNRKYFGLPKKKYTKILNYSCFLKQSCLNSSINFSPLNKNSNFINTEYCVNHNFCNGNNFDIIDNNFSVINKNSNFIHLPNTVHHNFTNMQIRKELINYQDPYDQIDNSIKSNNQMIFYLKNLKTPQHFYGINFDSNYIDSFRKTSMMCINLTKHKNFNILSFDPPYIDKNSFVGLVEYPQDIINDLSVLNLKTSIMTLIDNGIYQVPIIYIRSTDANLKSFIYQNQIAFINRVTYIYFCYTHGIYDGCWKKANLILI